MEPRFISEGSISIVRGGYRVNKPIIYYSKVLKRRIEIDSGFITDLASVPKVVPRWVVDVATGPTRLAAIVHDALCVDKYKKRYNTSQAQADKVWGEALKIQGVNWFSRQFLVGFVRAYQMAIHRQNYWKKL